MLCIGLTAQLALAWQSYLTCHCSHCVLLGPHPTGHTCVHELWTANRCCIQQASRRVQLICKVVCFKLFAAHAAGFIFGRNKPHETAAGAAGSTTKIAMTAPVTMSSSSQEGGAKKDDEAKKSEGSKEESEKIAMTAPVTMSEAGKGQQKAGSMTMSFIMPSKYKHVQDLPVPVDSRVTLQEV